MSCSYEIFSYDPLERSSSVISNDNNLKMLVKKRQDVLTLISTDRQWLFLVSRIINLALGESRNRQEYCIQEHCFPNKRMLRSNYIRRNVS